MYVPFYILKLHIYEIFIKQELLYIILIQLSENKIFDSIYHVKYIN